MNLMLVRSFLAALVVSIVGAAGAQAANRPAPVLIDNNATVETAITDVFDVNGIVLQNPTPATSDDTPLYDLVGTSLGVTWGQWKAPQVHSQVVELGDGKLDLVHMKMSGLIPNGVYSLFYYAFGLPGVGDTVNPDCPIETALAVHSLNPRQKPDRSSLVADAYGNATFNGSATGDLLNASNLVFELIYHRDGKTYGDLPNQGESLTKGPSCRSTYGLDAFRQTLILQRWE